MASKISSTRHRSNSVPTERQSRIATDIHNHFNEVRRSQEVNLGEDSHYSQPPTSGEIGKSEAVDAALPQTQGLPVPAWQRELAASRVGRQSRASSIISCRTRLTVQSDDARSVEIEAGGQSFRISRDGSRVTNTSAPPPYPGPPLEEVTEESDEDDSVVLSRQSADTIHDESSVSEIQAESAEPDLPIRTHIPLMTAELSHDTIRWQGGFELPQKLRSLLPVRWYSATNSQPTVSQISQSSRINTDLQRTQSDQSSLATGTPADHEPKAVRMETISQEGQSMSSPFLDAERRMQDLPWPLALSALDRASSDESATEATCYHRIMREMDRTHRKRLHERDSALATFRSLLNDQDAIYRQQLRERDHAIEALQEQLRHRDKMINDLKTWNYEAEEAVQERLEKARNEVEDVWESRWKEYEVILVDRVSTATAAIGTAGEDPAESSQEAAAD